VSDGDRRTPIEQPGHFRHHLLQPP